MALDIPREPHGGDFMKADWGRQVCRALRALRILPGTGYRVDQGSEGVHLHLEPPKGGGGAVAADDGCWRIVAETIEVEVDNETVSTVVHYIDRQYYMVGGMVLAGNDRTTIESFIDESKWFIAARIGYGKAGAENPGYGVQLRGYGSLAEMQADSLVKTYSLIPLYELQPPESVGGEEEDDSVPVVVVTDFRAMPVTQAFEMPTSGV